MKTATSVWNLSLLQRRDYTLILGRIRTEHVLPDRDRCWSEAYDTIRQLMRACESLDRNGLTLYTSCHRADNSDVPGFHCYDQIKSDALDQILLDHYPPHTLNLAPVLESALANYFQRRAAGKVQPNGEIILVLVDGEPSDRPELVKLLTQAAQQVTREAELGIGIVQVGNDAIARGFFQALDDDLPRIGEVRDIIHTQQIEQLNAENLMDFLKNTLFD